MSEFLYIYRNSETGRDEAMGTPERAQQSMKRWMTWMRELESKGHLKSPGQPLERDGKTVRGKAKAITDGPFLEAKDLVGGYTIIEARDLAQAAELALGCPGLDAGGSVEIRPTMKMDF